MTRARGELLGELNIITYAALHADYAFHSFGKLNGSFFKIFSQSTFDNIVVLRRYVYVKQL